jgi:hypothetical protein
MQAPVGRHGALAALYKCVLVPGGVQQPHDLALGVGFKVSKPMVRVILLERFPLGLRVVLPFG